MSKRVLIVISEYGYWAEEVVGPLKAFDGAGYTSIFITPTGKRPEVMPASLDPNFVDGPLGRTVTSPEVAELGKALVASARLDNPLSLEELFPLRPHWSAAPNYMNALEAYFRKLDPVMAETVAEYDALLIVGGSGPIVDIANNERVHALVLGFHSLGKLVAAECYGTACLAFARHCDTRRSIVAGKNITGHPREYDYKDGTSFVGVDFNMGPPPYPLEYILRDAVSPDGEFHSCIGKEFCAIADWPFVTGRSTRDSWLVGELIVSALDNGLRRYGW